MIREQEHYCVVLDVVSVELVHGHESDPRCPFLHSWWTDLRTKEIRVARSTSTTLVLRATIGHLSTTQEGPSTPGSNRKRARTKSERSQRPLKARARTHPGISTGGDESRFPPDQQWHTLTPRKIIDLAQPSPGVGFPKTESAQNRVRARE